MTYREELIQVAAVAVAAIQDLDSGRADALTQWDGPAWVWQVDAINNEVAIERGFQDQKWGEQHHTPMEWLAILGEEFGEACKAAVESHEWPEQGEPDCQDDCTEHATCRSDRTEVTNG